MSSEPAGGASNRTRASDAEREEIAKIVREAVGEGRLDIAEGDERLAAVYGAKYRDELAPLVNDLPAGQGLARANRPEPSPAAWRSGPWGPPPSYRRHYPPRRYAAGVVAHTGFVVILATALTLLWLVSGAGFFWPAIPLFFIVMGLGRHWRWATWRRWRDDERV